MPVSKPRQIFFLREERSSWPGGQPAVLYGWHRCGLWMEMVSGSWLTPWHCYRLPVGFCAWHIDTSTVSEHQVLWAFSGTLFLITSTSRIGCWQIGEVPASPPWATSMFTYLIPLQKPDWGTSSIASFSSRSTSRAFREGNHFHSQSWCRHLH